MTTLVQAAAARRPLTSPLATAAADESPQRLAAPLFSHEGPDLYAAAQAHNAPFVKPGPYQSQLTPAQATAFHAWAQRYQVPVTSDYNMPGFFLATGGAAHQAGAHFPDTFKTPLDTTFSAESKYAKPGTPFTWVGNSLVDARTGKVIFAGGGR